jgi:hypothetical protein
LRTQALLLAAACALPGRAIASGIVSPSRAWVVISTPELAAQYDTLWAVSDVHGQVGALEGLLLGAQLAVRGTEGRLRWNPAGSRQLLVVVGDCVDGGADSVAVVLLLQRLQDQAARAGSRVVVLLGNHEVAFLADPEANATAELVASASRARLGPPGGMTSLQLYDSEFGRYLRQLPVAAFIGSWLFAHAGYIDAEPDLVSLRAYFARVDGDFAAGGRRAYAALASRTSITAYHRWWASGRKLARMRTSLDLLGLNGLVIGHDPDALGARRVVAMNREGWLIKLDTGLKSGRTQGSLLRCKVSDVLREGSLVMAAGGRPTCSALSSRAVEDLAVK